MIPDWVAALHGHADETLRITEQDTRGSVDYYRAACSCGWVSDAYPDEMPDHTWHEHVVYAIATARHPGQLVDADDPDLHDFNSRLTAIIYALVGTDRERIDAYNHSASYHAAIHGIARAALHNAAVAYREK